MKKMSLCPVKVGVEWARPKFKAEVWGRREAGRSLRPRPASSRWGGGGLKAAPRDGARLGALLPSEFQVLIVVPQPPVPPPQPCLSPHSHPPEVGGPGAHPNNHAPTWGSPPACSKRPKRATPKCASW